MRAALALFLALCVPVQAAEPGFDALSHLLHEYERVEDAQAAAMPEADAPAESGARLARLSADLSLLAAGLESFRHTSHAERALGDLPERVAPELKPFFKDRDAALSTLYRTLAVTDYTWASRFPEPDCSPRERRSALLSARDGLFADENGGMSPWLARLLGPAAAGSPGEALDKASSRHALAPGEYAGLRADVARIGAALDSKKAVGAARAMLYCRRAAVYEALAGAHRPETGPIAAARALPDPGREAASVLLMTWSVDAKNSLAVGAGVVVETPEGPKVLTDARLQPDAQTSLRAILRGPDGGLGAARGLVIERSDPVAGVLVARLDGESPPALKLAASPAPVRDLVRAIGHVGAAGAWSATLGLVTETGKDTFASDAILGPDMLGSPILNEAGEVTGLVVLSPGAGVPAAVRAEHLRRVLDGARPAESALEFVAARQTGSGSLLTAATPFVGELSAPGGEAVAAGLPGSLGGVNWEGGGGVGNWRPSLSGGSGYSRSYSSGSSSYGSGSSGGAEMGRALGEALAPLIQALVFQGAPALFRGIGKLFDSGPKTARAPRPIKAEQPKVEKPKPPKPEYTLTLTVSKEEMGGSATFSARVGVNLPDLRVGGLTVNFELSSGEKASAVTDESGTAVLTVKIPPSVAAQEDLDSESVKYAALTNASRSTQAQNACQIMLMGAVGAAMVTATVAATGVSGPGGGALTATACVDLATPAIAAATLTCAAMLGAEAITNVPAPHRDAPPQVQPAQRGKSAAPAKARTAEDAVRNRAEAAMGELSSTGEDENSAGGVDSNDASTGQPADPGEEPPNTEQKGKTRRSAGSMQKQVERDQAPKSVERVDRARFPYEKDQVHFKDGSALNNDGTWKHGQRALANAEKGWLIENGWTLPR